MSAYLDDLHERVQQAGGAARSLTPVRFVEPPRRWPWAVAAAVLGAAAGAGVVVLLRRVIGQDAPDAQDPSELQAVVDTALPAA